MSKPYKFISILAVISFLSCISVPQNSYAESNEKLKVFLLSCAYGTAAGALLGVASLAFSEDPGAKLNQIARGASYGLYAGIGLGLYFNYGPQSQNQDVRISPFYITPLYSQNQKIDGIQGQVLIKDF